MHRVARLALLFVLPALCILPRAATAQFTDNRAWSTYLHAKSCNDILCTGDTVWLASGEAGLIRYVRSTGTWSSITREPSGLAGNSLQCLTFDARGNLFVGVPGKGVSRLSTDGRWSLINEFDGLPSDTALVMRAQGDTVWVGTTRGLALWNGTTLAGSIPDRGTVSPFASDQITGIGFTGDTMFVATAAGMYLALKSERLRRWTAINSGLPFFPEVRSLATNGRTVTVVCAGKNSTGGGLLTSFTWFPSAGAWGSDFPQNQPAVRRVRDDFGTILATTVVSPVIDGGIYKRHGPGDWELLVGSPRTDNDDLTALEVGMAPDGETFSFARGSLKSSADWTRALVPPGPVGNNCLNVYSGAGRLYANYNDEGVSRLYQGIWRNWPSSDVCIVNCDTTFTSSAFPFGGMVDPQGYKWVGVWTGPLARFTDDADPPQFKNNHYSSTSADTTERHSFIWSAAADASPGADAGRWFGLDSNDRDGRPALGIDLYDSSGTFVRSFTVGYPGLRNGQVRALAVDKDNVMWVGYAQNPTAGLSTFPVPKPIGSDIVLSDVKDTRLIDCFGIQIYGDSVWVLASDGLNRFDRNDRKLVAGLDIAGPPAPLGAVHPLAVAPDGSLFVGTTGGVRWHRRGRAPVDFTPDNSPLANIEVRAITVEPTGVVWIGTSSGINRFDPGFVPPPAPVLPALHVTVYPNPAWRTQAGFELKLRGEATRYVGEIFDINGRLVKRFVADGNDRVVWNGFDLDGAGVGAGVYFLKVRGGGAETTSRIVVLR